MNLVLERPMPTTRTAKTPVNHWTSRVRSLLSDANGRLRYGALLDLSRGTGLPSRKLRSAICEGFPPRREGAMVVRIAKYLNLDALDLLDPKGGTRPAGDVIARGVEMTGPAFRPVLLCASVPHARAELQAAARRICRKYKLK